MSKERDWEKYLSVSTPYLHKCKMSQYYFLCIEKTLQVSSNFYCKEKCFILIGKRNLCQLYFLNRYTIFFSKDNDIDKSLHGILPFKELFPNY